MESAVEQIEKVESNLEGGNKKKQIQRKSLLVTYVNGLR